ncbi:MAG: GNAT family N-acetyltransferase [Clostridiaceae bacterium]|nr:GNAT family N-acetyltransferase [Clostridiaceae bacterium]
MNYRIDKMTELDWEEVSCIYLEGINTGKATFQTEVPSWEDWDKGHVSSCRLVARLGDVVLGWGALSPTSSRCVYEGVAEVSVYIGEKYRGQGLGKILLENLIKQSEENGFWTLQSGIISENISSIALHESCGFRVLGIREKIAKMNTGKWHDVVLMERRSKNPELVTNKSEKAALIFNQGFNCSQAVFSVFCEELGLGEEVALKISCGFGGGMCQGEVCGAVTGAVMALGLKYGQSKSEDTESKEKTYEVVKEFCDSFKAIHSSIICKDLLDFDLSKENGRKIAREKGLFTNKCPKAIKDAINILEQIL